MIRQHIFGALMMNVRWFISVLISFSATILYASVELSTSINNVHHRGSQELSGTISWTVIDDEFRDASPAFPIFIRVTPDHNASLSQSLVLQSSPNSAINQPIHLALRLMGSGTAMNADPDAVSIVR
jgi:hypothetical protein